MKINLSYLFLIILISCSGKENEANKQAGNTTGDTLSLTGQGANLPEQETEEVAVSYEFINPEIKQAIIRLDSLYGRTPFYTKTGNGYLFYVCRGNCGKLISEDSGKADFLLGISDAKGNLLLPVEYTRLHNPDLTAKGFIETEKNGKRGLFNYKNGAIIPAKYELIFPSNVPGISAILKSGKEYFTVNPEGKTELLKGNIPSYVAADSRWAFNIRSSNINLLFDSYAAKYEGEAIEGDGVIFPPSYICELGFVPEVLTGISFDPEVDFARIEGKGEIIEKRSVTDKIYAFISSFFDEGIDARGYQITKTNLITVDSENNVLSVNELLQDGQDFIYYYCSGKLSGYRFIQNDLLEVYDLNYTEKDYPKYDQMRVFSYYKINEKGEIKKLESNRLFDATKFVRLAPYHFHGCFATSTSRLPDVDSYDGNMLVRDHLDMEDLDIMRNEIFAEYGYKFSSEKWQTYFEKMPWYKPLYDNVDHLLTDTDKENVRFIQQYQKEMKGKEEEYTKKRAIRYSAPG